MRVYGTSVLPLRLSEWQGNVELSVIDLDTDYNIILGLPWHRENRPVIHWDTMIYEAEQNGEMRKIFPSADSKFIDTEEIMSLNMIDSRQAKKALKRKGTEFAVYYFCNTPAKEDGADAFAPVVEGVTSPEQRQLNELLEEYKHVLRSRLPGELPP